MFMSVLKVDNLTKTFSSGFWPFKKTQIYTAVDTISFELRKGEILGFLGPNGAGKTTTIQMLLGTLTPSGGSINYFGADFAQHRIAALKCIGYASGYDKLPARITVADNLDIVGRIYGIAQPFRAQQIEKLLKFFNIWDKRDAPTGSLSAGQATRVMLAKAFIADPEIVLLDEPTASLDPDVAHEVRQFILAQCKERGISILITSHNMDEVTELCDRVLVLKNGTIIADNTPEELARSTSKVRVHLTITDALDRMFTYLAESALTYTIQANHLTIELDEHAIAQFLMQLAERNIIYSHISIDKPTLEDYFLSVVRDEPTVLLTMNGNRKD
jgi:ABC-2 type transport system ATP-binding protein